MTETTPGVPLGAWLAELDDERLIRLLELRPDLTQPPPGTIAALAARAQARQSVKAATDGLDFLRLAVLDALLVLHADTAAVPLSKLLALIGDRASEDTVTAAVDDLRERALVWGDATVRVAAEAAAWPALVSGSGHPRGQRADGHRRQAGSARRGRNSTCCSGCWRARRWAAPATPRRAPRRTGRCSGCWPQACCVRWIPTP